jgi:choline/glycine/proline betaine transport protein
VHIDRRASPTRPSTTSRPEKDRSLVIVPMASRYGRISWSPFVGMFLARMSYGRTIRSFVAGALFAPVGASMVWLTVFGETALSALLANHANPLSQASTETGMFVLLQQLPVAGILSLVASVVAIVVVLFFATSSDSGRSWSTS